MLRDGSCLFTCEIEVQELDIFLKILLKRLKVTYDLVFLLDPKGNELQSLEELRSQPYFVLSGRHILWSLAETPLHSYIKVHR